MPVNPSLVTALGTQFQIQSLTDQQVTPTPITITVTAAAAVGATSLTVTVTPSSQPKKFYEGQILVANPNETAAQYVYVAANSTDGNPTSLTVEPLKKAIAANDVITSFLGIPVIGLESANMQLQTETNQAVLLANQGWQITDSSTGSFQFDGTLYIPKQNIYNTGAKLVDDALLNKLNIYVERYLPNGEYHAGICVVTNASDTVSGSAYITKQVTFMGSNKPVRLNYFDVTA
jgi:hypothetical protein